MKLPTVSPGWKFLAGLSLYAFVIVILSLFDDYRIAIGGFMILGSVTFALALWAIIKTGRFIGVVVAASILGMPLKASEPPERKENTVIMGCAVLVVGAIIIWGVWKICKKLPVPPRKGSAPPSTNDVASAAGPINSLAPPLLMPEATITGSDDWDTAPMTFQSSTNGIDWRDEYTVTNWFSPNLAIAVIYSNGIPLMTNAAPIHYTNENIVLNFSSVLPSSDMSPVKLWRSVQQ